MGTAPAPTAARLPRVGDPRPRPFRPAPAWRPAHLLTALGTAVLVTLLVPGTALASEGFSNYEGTFSSSAPTGYGAAPADTHPNSSVAYDFQVTNQGLFNAQLSATVYVEHLATYQTTPGGPVVDISNPATAVDESTLLSASALTGSAPVWQPLEPDDATLPGTLAGQPQPVPYNELVRVGACGYFAIWVGDNNASALSTLNPDYMPASQATAFLNAGIVRVERGCPSAPAPTPTPTTGHTMAGSSTTPTKHNTQSARSGRQGPPAPSAKAKPAAPTSQPQAASPASTLAPSTGAGQAAHPTNANVYPFATLSQGIQPSTLMIAGAVVAVGLGGAAVIFLRERMLRAAGAGVRWRRRPFA